MGAGAHFKNIGLCSRTAVFGAGGLGLASFFSYLLRAGLEPPFEDFPAAQLGVTGSPSTGGAHCWMLAHRIEVLNWLG